MSKTKEGEARVVIMSEWARSVLRVLLLLSLVGSSWWLLNLSTQTSEPTVADSKPAADAYLKHFELLEMDERGKPRQKISGALMEHFDSTSTSEVLQPDVVLYSESGAAWHIHAASGVMPDDAKVVMLIGPVRARSSGGEQHETIIDTADVEIDTDAQTARTDAAVTITSAGSVTNGSGLRANMQTRQYQLQSKVQGHYTGATASR